MDVQLAVGAGQVCLDGFRADEQGIGYFTVGHAGGGQPGDPVLGGCKTGTACAVDVDPFEFVLCPAGPQWRAELAEDARRLPQRHGGGLLAPPAALDLAEDEQGAGALERHGQPLVLDEGTFGSLGCPVQVTGGGQQKALAARTERQRPRTIQPPTVAFQLVCQRGRFLQPAHPDQRFHGVCGPD